MSSNMKTFIKLEELAQFILGILLFSQLDFLWWVFPAALLLPDVSMLGYLANPRVGAGLYNLLHHKLTGVAVLAAGYLAGSDMLALAGIILFAHSAMDRIFGYGLKYPNSFKHTHLGVIGREGKQ
jgi:hypothetical protein